jgi:glycosyltransferase involved in cell wall biosynthesis
MKEAFAQTPIESMACGVPAIVFPVSGTDELITPQNGVRADDFTEESLRQAIKTAMSTSFDSKAIRQDMITRFSPNVIAKKYIAFYHQIFDNRKR